MAGKTSKSSQQEIGNCGLSEKQYRELAGRIEKSLKEGSRELRDLMEQVKVEINEVAAGLRTAMERQDLETLSSIRSAADSVQRSDSTSADLTSQVASLRDYLARQQELVKRFQDGYDWSVVKNFCSRIIRCIDDVQKRMDTTEDINEAHRADLELIYDQLVFALDGSGVEQFAPEPGTPYKGQEKTAEVVGKDSSEDGRPGCISSVVAPGYSFFVSEEQRRLVRPAKVRLYARSTEGSEEVE